MTTFVPDPKTGLMQAEMSEVRFCCRESKAGYQKKASDLLTAYRIGRPRIISFLLHEIFDMYDAVPQEMLHLIVPPSLSDSYFPGAIFDPELQAVLGTPVINLDNDTLMFPEQQLDKHHSYVVEFGGLFEKLYYVTVNG